MFLRPLFIIMIQAEGASLPSLYFCAAQSLRRRLPKRSLVIVVSNLRDEDHDELSNRVHPA